MMEDSLSPTTENNESARLDTLSRDELDAVNDDEGLVSPQGVSEDPRTEKQESVGLKTPPSSIDSNKEKGKATSSKEELGNSDHDKGLVRHPDISYDTGTEKQESNGENTPLSSRDSNIESTIKDNEEKEITDTLKPTENPGEDGNGQNILMKSVEKKEVQNENNTGNRVASVESAEYCRDECKETEKPKTNNASPETTKNAESESQSLDIVPQSQKVSENVIHSPLGRKDMDNDKEESENQNHINEHQKVKEDGSVRKTAPDSKEDIRKESNTVTNNEIGVGRLEKQDVRMVGKSLSDIGVDQDLDTSGQVDDGERSRRHDTTSGQEQDVGYTITNPQDFGNIGNTLHGDSVSCLDEGIAKKESQKVEESKTQESLGPKVTRTKTDVVAKTCLEGDNDGKDFVLKCEDEDVLKAENNKSTSSEYSMIRNHQSGVNEDSESSAGEEERSEEHEVTPIENQSMEQEKVGQLKMESHISVPEEILPVPSHGGFLMVENQFELFIDELLSDPIIDENRDEWKKNSKRKFQTLYRRMIDESSVLRSDEQVIVQNRTPELTDENKERNTTTTNVITKQPGPVQGLRTSQRGLKQEAEGAKSGGDKSVEHADKDPRSAKSDGNLAQAIGGGDDKSGANRRGQHIRTMAKVVVGISHPTDERKLQLGLNEKDLCLFNYIMDRPGATENYKSELRKKNLLIEKVACRLNHHISIAIRTDWNNENLEVELKSVLHKLSQEMNITVKELEMEDEGCVYEFWNRCHSNFPLVLLLRDDKNPLKLYLVGKLSAVSEVGENPCNQQEGDTRRKKVYKLSKELDCMQADVFKHFRIDEKLRAAYPDVKIVLDDQYHIHMESRKDDCDAVFADCSKEIDAILQNGEILHELSDEEILFLEKKEVKDFVKTKVKEKHILSVTGHESEDTLKITLYIEKKEQRKSILKRLKQSIEFVDASLIPDIYLILEEKFLKGLNEKFGDKFEFLANGNAMVTQDIKGKFVNYLNTCMETVDIRIANENFASFCRKFRLSHWQKLHGVKVEASNKKWIVKGKIGAPKLFVQDYERELKLLRTSKRDLNEFQFKNITESLVEEIEKKNECSIELHEEESCSKLQQDCWRSKDGYTVSIMKQKIDDVQSGLIVRVDSRNITSKEMRGEKFACKLQGIRPGVMETVMIVPYWKDGKCKECDSVENFARNILEMKGMDKVAFPLDLNNSCGMPQKKFMKSVLQAFNNLKSKGLSPEIQHVTFCQPKEKEYKEAVKILSDKMKSQEAEAIPNAVLFGSSAKRLKVEIIKGDITASKCDVIVNNTSNTLQLEHGIVSANISRAAGEKLQQECSNKYSSGILYGGIAVTRGYNLGCKHVFHGALQTYDPGRKSLQVFESFLEKCMDEANKVFAKSISFPALGTGNLKYPREKVAESMFRTVYTCWSRAKNCSVELVQFCLYEKDYKTVKAFEDEEWKWRWPQLEENSQSGLNDPQKGKFSLLCTSESEATNGKAVSLILEKLGGARSKTKAASVREKSEPQSLGKTTLGSQKENADLTTDPEKEKENVEKNHGSVVHEIERDHEQRRLLVTIADQSLMHKGEDAVKSEFQKEILGDKDVQHVVYPFSSTDKLLVVCLSKEDADCLFKSAMKRKRSFEVQKLMTEAVTNVKAKMSSQVMTILISNGYEIVDISKHSGVTVMGNDTLFGSLLEIKVAQQFLISVCKKELQKQSFARQTATHDSKESIQADDSTHQGSENFNIEQNQSLKEKERSKTNTQEMRTERDTEEYWPEFECKQWEFHALNSFLPEVVKNAIIHRENLKVFIQGNKDTIAALDEQILKIRAMKRKDLSFDTAREMKRKYIIPWADSENQIMLLEDGDKIFMLYSSAHHLKASMKTLGITGLEKSFKLNPEQKPGSSSIVKPENYGGEPEGYNKMYPKLNPKSVIISKMQQGMVMELENGIKIFAYTAMLDEVPAESIVLESEMQVTDVSAYSRYMFEKMGSQALETVKMQSQKCSETEAFISEVGHLKIIHFKNPRKTQESNLDKKKESIISCVKNCLGKADDIELTTIAFPPICTGICSLKICAQCYVDGILQYGKLNDRLSTTLREVHFVDSNANTVDEISQAFNDYTFATGMIAPSNKRPQNPMQSRKTTLYIQAGKITKVGVEAICCCEYVTSGKMPYVHGFISGKIHDYKRQHRQKYDLNEKLKGKVEVGSTVVMSNKDWLDVIHVWLPPTRNATSVSGDLKDEYFKQYAYCMKNMLEEADQSGYPSIACSLFGAGSLKAIAVERCASALIKTIKEFIPKHVKEIYIVEREDWVLKKLKKQRDQQLFGTTV